MLTKLVFCGCPEHTGGTVQQGGDLGLSTHTSAWGEALPSLRSVYTREGVGIFLWPGACPCWEKFDEVPTPDPHMRGGPWASSQPQLSL